MDMNNKPILIDALHINMGGGLMILNHLVNNLVAQMVDFVLLKDIRCPKLQSEDEIPHMETLSSDTKTRNDYYKAHRHDFRTVLCFGNIPPGIRLPVKVYTYLHNVNLLTIPHDYPLKHRVISFLKKHYIRHYSKNTDAWIVQTSYTAQLVRNHLASDKQPIFEFPFYYIPDSINRIPKHNRSDYVFIGEHTGAKGHEYLVEAWEKLSKLGIKRTLHLTVTEPQFVEVINVAISRGANICNHGKISFNDVVELYNKSKATVYPSLNESLGLGIVEALEAGCDVIGCDLPYVKSICEPSGIFKPRSSDSIVDAILDYENGGLEESKLTIRDMINDFINFLYDYEQKD